MKATFGHQTRAPTELINDNTASELCEIKDEACGQDANKA